MTETHKILRILSIAVLVIGIVGWWIKSRAISSDPSASFKSTNDDDAQSIDTLDTSEPAVDAELAQEEAGEVALPQGSGGNGSVVDDVLTDRSENPKCIFQGILMIPKFYPAQSPDQPEVLGGKISYILTGLFFLASLFWGKPVIQEFAEKSGMATESFVGNRRFYIRWLTKVWVGYFFVKAALYFWLAGAVNLETAMIVRAVTGKFSFVALIVGEKLLRRQILLVMNHLSMQPIASTRGQFMQVGLSPTSSGPTPPPHQ